MSVKEVQKNNKKYVRVHKKLSDFTNIFHVIGQLTDFYRDSKLYTRENNRSLFYRGIWNMPCTFHESGTELCMKVYLLKNHFKCTVCGCKGDRIDFIQEHEHMSHLMALKHPVLKGEKSN